MQYKTYMKMKTEIMALEIELKSSVYQNGAFSFNDTMLHAVQSGLSVIYSEVFIWKCGKHLAVWAVGDHDSLLIQTFAHHQSHFEKSQLLDQPHAISLLEDITLGKSWAECDVQNKLASLKFGFNLSNELNSFSTKLLPFISTAQHTLQTLYHMQNGDDKVLDILAYDGEDTVMIANNVFQKFSLN